MKLLSNTLVRVSGEVKYGNSYYRVDSMATVIQDYGNGNVKCNIAYIDGDLNVVCTVKKSLLKLCKLRNRQLSITRPECWA